MSLDHPFAAPIPVTTLVSRLMAMACMTSTANGVRAITNVMLLSTTSTTAQCLQLICLPGWNKLVSHTPLANAPMESRWYLIWDATYPDTFAPSHLPCATREAGAVAALAVRSKQEKYAALNQYHNTRRQALWARDFVFWRELNCCLKQVTGEAKSFSYLRQRLYVAV